MSNLLNFQKDILNKLESEVSKYYHTYFSSDSNLGRGTIIANFINNLPKNYKIFYMINDNDSKVNEIYYNFLSHISNFSLSTTLGIPNPNTLYIFSANEVNLKNKIKKITNTNNTILINDCTYNSKLISLTPLISKINPEKIISITFPERLTPTEKSNILMNKCGNVYANVDLAISESYLIKGFLSPTQQELNFSNNLPLETNLVILGKEKRDYLQNILNNMKINKNLINIICVDKKDKISIIKEILINEGIKTNEIKTDNTKNTENIKYIITSNISKYNNYNQNIMVITMLKNTCKAGVLFDVVKNLSLNYIKYDSSIDSDIQYKYLITYDEIKTIKNSLKPVYETIIEKEVIQNKCRKDITPISFLNSNLKFATFNSIPESKESVVHLNNALYNMFENSIKKIKKYNFDYKKESQTIMVDSFIKTYNEYNINSMEIVDSILEENQKLCLKAISSALTSQDILNNKINGTKTANWVMKYLENYFLYYKIKGNDFYNMIINDLKNQSYSIFRYIFDNFCYNYEKTENIKLKGEYKRKEEKYMINIPFDIEEIRPSDIIKTKKCGMMYATNPKQENEKLFLQYLENNVNVDWWIKNGDNGKNYFSLTYYVENEPFSFYPDWIIMLTNGKVLITDTKDGRTVNDNGLTGIKLEALREYCKGKGFYYGITTQLSGVWRISDPNNVYYIDKNFTNFIYLDNYLNEINKF